MSDVPTTPEADYAAPFRRVADKIDLNRDNGFGGAFVIVPPEGAPQDMLLLDNAQNPAMFWSLLKTRAEIALVEIEAHERGGQQFRGR